MIPNIFIYLLYLKILLAPAITLVGAMNTIRKISANMLQEKLADLSITADDTTSKRDIMSLLVRARVADKSGGYYMSDSTMMDQVVIFSVP